MSYSDALAKFNHEKDEMVPLIDGLNTMQTYLASLHEKQGAGPNPIPASQTRS
jgi:hypothetical protein